MTEFGAPPLAGEEFLAKWQGKALGALFELTRATMPLESPARLSRREYADILAHMLKVNGFMPGDHELSNEKDALKAIIIGSPAESH